MPAAVHAQQKWFDVVSADTTVFLDFLVIPESIQVVGARSWQFDAPSGRLRLRTEPPASVMVLYRRLPVDLPVHVSRTRGEPLDRDPASSTASSDGPVQTRPLDRSGSFTRGFRVGTDRDLTLESGMRFDISGYVTETVFLTASLTDRSTPIQPDGTTQALRDIDQVRIRFEHPSWSLDMGDVDVSLRSGTFLRYGRRLQGASATTMWNGNQAVAVAAVTRGTFRQQIVRPQEGVLGPYRLTDTADEPFAVVVAGTESVWMDGERLTRGEDGDYIMDYALGELTFTGRRMIRSTHRIVVDFQVLGSGFSRTILGATAESRPFSDGRVRFGFGFIREADDLTFIEDIGIGDAERAVLRAAGDDPRRAVASGIDSIGFRRDADLILYVRRDTLGITIYEHRPGDPAAIFRVRFSRVEPGTGSYQRSATLANGSVFRWVGAGSGDYEPFRLLPMPEEHLLLSTFATVELTPALTWHTDLIGSMRDRNRLSGLDDLDNLGVGWQTGLTLRGPVRGHLHSRRIDGNLRLFDRIDSPDFDRNWALRRPADGVGEWRHLLEMDMDAGMATKIGTTAGWIERGAERSRRLGLDLMSSEPGLPTLTATGTYAEARGGYIGRSAGETGFGGRIRPFLRWDAEQVRQTAGTRFADISPGFRYDGGRHFKATLSRGFRSDETRQEKGFRQDAATTTWSAELEAGSGRRARTANQLVVSRRQTRTGDRSDGLSIRSDSEFRSLDRAFDLRLTHEAATESRSLLEEVYIEVGSELGQFVWVDLNSDGLQQIDEFFPETLPDEGTFIRQFRPTDTAFPVVQVGSSIRFHGDLRRWVPGMAVRTSVDIREQSRTDAPFEVVVLRPSALMDPSATVRGRIRIRQDVDLFRGHPEWDLRLRGEWSRRMERPVLGLETGMASDVGGTVLWRAPSDVQLGGDADNTYDRATNGSVPGRSWRMDGFRLSPFIRWRPYPTLQSEARVAWARKTDRVPMLPTSADSWRVRTDLVGRFGGRLDIQTAVEWREVRLTGNPGPYAEWQLTDAAGPGRSVFWTAHAQLRLRDGIRASLRYDGRTRERGGAIQTLNLSMTAVF
jgi:hypothetical protein